VSVAEQVLLKMLVV